MPDTPFPPGYVPNPKDDSIYGYIPTLWITVLFVVLFSLTSIVHLFQGIRYRIWWAIPTFFICGLAEVIGWSGRLWSAKNPWIRDPFLIQICCTIFAPTFLTAGMFFIFGRLTSFLGTEYSRLTPRAYAIIFIGADVAALVVQSIGGARASAAETNEAAEVGAKIMVAGIIIQMAAITLYVIVQTEYLIRVFKDRPFRPRVAPGTVPLSDSTPPNEKVDGGLAGNSSHLTGRQRVTRDVGLMLAGLVIATVFIYIRSIYRTIELLDGWNGKIITDERLFNVLDGMPVFLAMFTLNVFHVGRLLPKQKLNAVAAGGA